MPATLLAFAPVSIHLHVRQDQRVLQGLPCRQPHTGTALVQPVHRFVFCIFHLLASMSIQFIAGRSQGLHWAAGYLPVLVFTAHLHSFHEPETAFGQPGSLLHKWPVGWRIAAGLG